TCTVRRERTNTPLQALMLMNDPQFVEAARHLAQATLDTPDANPEQRIQWMFQRCLARPARADELKTILSASVVWLQQFRENPERAKQLISIGEQPASDKYNPAELAAWTMVANLLLNMDEFLTKN
ncbi:MAG: DUF1553 domain-containing protein, partial [Pirellulaceae bacterium]|nr:DUF1553 domain-containing protein [Pirellulaceae bacterium]